MPSDMSQHLNSFRERHQEEFSQNALDKRLLELSALFEISQTLNSTLNLKNILDTILFVPMGRMMISKGIVLIERGAYEYTIENSKGLPLNLIHKSIHISRLPEHPLFLSQATTDEDWLEFFREFHIELLLPLISKREFRGLIGFSKKLTGQQFDDEEVEFLSSLSQIALQSIENALVFDQLNQVNRELDHKIQELNTVFEIGKELNQIFEPQDILKQLSYSLMGQMLVNQFFVALMENNKLQIVFKKGSRFNEASLAQCIESCENLPEMLGPVLITDLERFSKIAETGVQVIVPMHIQNSVKGFIFLGEKLDKSSYQAHNLEFLATLSNMAMIALENARLIIETIEKKRMEEELNLARSIQQRLLPDQMPVIQGYDVDGYNMPSRQVGGDYFDIIPLSDSEYIFTIADVSGKGIPAAIIMSNLQAALHTLVSEQYPLNEVTAKLNNLIFKNTTIEKFITFFIMKLNIMSGDFEYVNAGHNAPIHFSSADAVENLDKGGIILGIMANMSYETGLGIMNPGDCLTLFTDGLTEAMDDEGVEFEEKRVIDFFGSSFKELSAAELNKKMYQVVFDFGGDPTRSDDFTILTIKRSLSFK
jgi:sigma-B regulation protein RsbU (phosphoserine phosphatase)